MIGFRYNSTFFLHFQFRAKKKKPRKKNPRPSMSEFYRQWWRTCAPPAISLHLNKLSIGFRELLSLLGWRRLLILSCGSPSWSPARSVLPHPPRSVSTRDTTRPKMHNGRFRLSLALDEERPRLVSTVTSSSRHQKTPRCPKDSVHFLLPVLGNARLPSLLFSMAEWMTRVN